MRTFWGIEFFKLVRFDTSILTACIVFVPVAIRESNYLLASQRALPILLICTCCFVLNDIADVEKDRINHPLRPLPSGAISQRSAMGIYFFLLTAALLSIYAYVEHEQYYIYLLCLIVFTNYNHVVSDFPLLKNPYVSLASVLPILILRPLEFAVSNVDMVALAMCFFIFGRELLMDVQDLGGDGNTLAKRLGQSVSSKLGFGTQFFAMGILFLLARDTTQLTVVAFLLVTGIVAVTFWRVQNSRRLIVHGMKIQAISGLVFLF